MNNEVVLKPLIEYTVRFSFEQADETFTADTMVRDDGDILFYRTGNLIKVYTPEAHAASITMRPADEQIPV